jgi:ferritin
MLSKTMTDALNKHINAEIYSAYLYMAMSAQASYSGFPGMANWFTIQTKEELSHAEKLYAYVNSQGEHVILEAIEQPRTKFDTPLDMFKTTLKHEQLVTSLINKLADLAIEEKDHATQIMLQWFITEQVEEEENARDIIDRLKLTGNEGQGLFMIDKELGSRVFVPPSA